MKIIKNIIRVIILPSAIWAVFIFHEFSGLALERDFELTWYGIPLLATYIIIIAMAVAIATSGNPKDE